jgi:hypothetical protein
MILMFCGPCSALQCFVVLFDVSWDRRVLSIGRTVTEVCCGVFECFQCFVVLYSAL